MKILLEQVITSATTKTRITLINSTIDNQKDAYIVHDAIESFDILMINSGVFNDNDHIHLEINGADIGYGQLSSTAKMVEFIQANQ